MAKGKRRKSSNFERTAENDIRFRGPLSYRHLMIIGWICISFMILGILTNLGISLDPKSPKWMFTLNSVSVVIGQFAIPLFLLSNFCIILDEKKTYKQLLMKYAGLTLLVVVLYVVIISPLSVRDDQCNAQ